MRSSTRMDLSVVGSLLVVISASGPWVCEVPPPVGGDSCALTSP